MRVSAKIIWVFLALVACRQQPATTTAENRWRTMAAQVTITRDNYGVPHVYGQTDSAAVFGLLYAQCEDDFASIEYNYLEKLGRLSELYGSDYLYIDLYARLMQDTAVAMAQYRQASPATRSLLNAFADGINYYLYTHPETQPKRITKFEPWYALVFTDGSYTGPPNGGLQMEDLHAFYILPTDSSTAFLQPRYRADSWAGSNAFALSPSRTADSSTLLYINPHTSFYYRTEAQVSSASGWNAYGAITWGQFTVYQGFNEHLAWMHTSTDADAADLYIETIREKAGGGYEYLYDSTWKPLPERKSRLHFATSSGMDSLTITIPYTLHGPVIGKRNNQWLSLATTGFGLPCLEQALAKMRSKNLDNFTSMMASCANSSTNTMYSDEAGNIAYWHGNQVPKRPSEFDWSAPVDGSTSASAWQGFHPLADLVQWHNPKIGYLQNCNSSPYFAAGDPPTATPPTYLAPESDNFRAVLARRRLRLLQDATADSLIAVGFDRHLLAFEKLLPLLYRSYTCLARNDALRHSLNPYIEKIRQWNLASDTASAVTTWCCLWSEQLLLNLPANDIDFYRTDKHLAAVERKWQGSAAAALLQDILVDLKKKAGTTEVPWGEYARFQRVANGSNFNDEQPSHPVAFGSSLLGALPSIDLTSGKGWKKYGYGGNSFIAVVSLKKGRKLEAWSVVAGGQSADPSSPHFDDQATLFLKGKMKKVVFYPDEINAFKNHHPGEKQP